MSGEASPKEYNSNKRHLRLRLTSNLQCGQAEVWLPVSYGPCTISFASTLTPRRISAIPKSEIMYDALTVRYEILEYMRAHRNRQGLLGHSTVGDQMTVIAMNAEVSSK